MGVREKYEEKVDAQLHEWREWIEHYKTGAIINDFGQPANRQQMIERLENCQQIAQTRLEELQSSPEGQWELSKQAVERAMIDLKRLLDESGVAHAGRSLSLQTSRSHVYEPFSKRG